MPLKCMVVGYGKISLDCLGDTIMKSVAGHTRVIQ